MKPRSGRALMWASAILVLSGMAIGAPGGALALFVLAALCAAAGLLLGKGWVRVVSALLLLAAGAYAVVFYHAYRKELDRYRQRARERARTQAPEAPPAGRPSPK